LAPTFEKRTLNQSTGQSSQVKMYEPRAHIAFCSASYQPKLFDTSAIAAPDNGYASPARNAQRAAAGCPSTSAT
jgi:hypothetical protein